MTQKARAMALIEDLSTDNLAKACVCLEELLNEQRYSCRFSRCRCIDPDDLAEIDLTISCIEALVQHMDRDTIEIPLNDLISAMIRMLLQQTEQLRKQINPLLDL